MSPHQLNNVALKADARGEPEILIAVNQGPLIMFSDNVVVSHLRRDLSIPNKRVAQYRVVLKKVCERIRSGSRHRRPGRKIFDNIHQGYIHDARNLAQFSQSRPAEKHALPAKCRSCRSHRTVGAAERTFGLITEGIANPQLPALPADFLVNSQFLNLLKPNPAGVVVAHSSEVVESQIVVLPQPLQFQTTRSIRDGVNARSAQTILDVGIQRLAYVGARLQVAQRRGMGFEVRQIQS